MKNLFDFATKELSQDAFLRWLFENYDCDDFELRKASRSLILKFIDNDNYNEDSIIELWTKSQDHKADISMWIEMSDKKYGIIIEDKTYSNEHDNQLLKYKEIFDNDGYWQKNTNQIIYIFYKTGKIHNWEREKVKEFGWSEFSFDNIYNFWLDYKDSKNIILNQYANHIIDLHDKRTNIIKPNGNDGDVSKWEAYFENTVKPIFDDYVCWVNINYHGYAYICFQAKCFSFSGAPYLEIRSRDCYNDSFQSRILTYGLDNNKENNLRPDECQIIRNAIRNSARNSNVNSLFKVNNGTIQNKQLCVSPVVVNINNNEKFIEELKLHLNVFEDIIKSTKLEYDFETRGIRTDE